MKKIPKGLGMAIYIFLLLLVNSCGKEQQTPQVGVVTPPPIIPVVVPTITWTVSPTDTKRGDTSFYKEIRTITITTVNADSAGIAGTSGASSVTTGQMELPETFTAVAVNKTGGRTTSTKTLQVYSQRKTNIIGGAKGIKWGTDSVYSGFTSDSLVEPTIMEFIPDFVSKNIIQFFTDNTAKVWIPSGPAMGEYRGVWSFHLNETHLLFPGDEPYYIEVLTNNKMVISYVKKVINGTEYGKFRNVLSVRQ